MVQNVVARPDKRAFFMASAAVIMAAFTMVLFSALHLRTNITTSNRAIDFGALPLAFEPNSGQSDPAVRFTVRQPLGTLYFTASGMVLALSEENSISEQTKFASLGNDLSRGVTARRQTSTLGMSFVDANPDASMSGGEMLGAKVNYLLGDDPARWQADVPTYDSVTYGDIYAGIDLRYEGAGGLLKGTYFVAEGVDPSVVRWSYSGAQGTSVDPDGNLLITLQGSGLEVIEQAPVAWQEIGGVRVPVDVQYSIGADGSIGFSLGAYDKAQPLTIDPTMQYSTYLGGSIADQGWSMQVDAAGNTYITGYTASSNFPTLNGFQPNTQGQGDGFVSKFNTAGQLVYSTYLGGDYVDSAQALDIDAAGNTYVMGWTGSENFPVRNAFQPAYAGGWDVFVTKLNAQGNDIIFSTFLGGSESDLQISGGIPGGIAVDGAGNVYVAGDTTSDDFPMLNALQATKNGTVDAFVTKLAPSGSSLVYSTYLGGEAGDVAFEIEVDSSGSAIITGQTTSFDYPTVNAYQPACAPSAAVCYDVIVTKFSPDGQSLVYSTYLGGNDVEFVDAGISLAIDAAGAVYVTGMTGSTNFPLMNPYQGYGGQVDVFVSKFSATGSLLYSTNLGGNNSDVGYDIALNSAGNFYVTGLTISQDYPTVNAIQSVLGGTEDAILTKFSPDGQSLVYSTYFGGSTGREEWGATGIGLDAQNNVYIAGMTEATNFPVLNPHQPTNHGSYDVFVTKFEDTTQPPSPTPTVCGTDYTITPSNGAAITPGTLDIGHQCTSCVTQIPLPFAFTLYGNTYSSAYVASNGTLRFEDIFIPTVNQPLPADTPQYTLMPYWDDLYTSGTGDGIYTSISGSAPDRIFNIEWRAHHFGTQIPANFEIRLYENGSGMFEFVYGDTGGRQGDSATVGVQEDFHGRYTQYSYNSGVINPGLRLTFVLGCGTVTPGPTNTAAPTGTSTSTSTSTSTGTSIATSTGTAVSTSTGVPSASVTAQATGTGVPATSTATATTTVAATGTVMATATVCAITFTDVEVGSTFYANIRCLACRGIITGYPDGTFRPGNLVTRGQLSKIAANAAGFNEPVGGRSFEDVAVGSTFYEFVERLAVRNIVSGYECGGAGEPCGAGNLPYFRPNANVTRGQISKIVAEAAGLSQAATGQQFQDVPEGSTFYVWIWRLADMGVMNGYACGSPGEPCGDPALPYFRPGANATRGQASKIVANTFFPECGASAR